MIILCRSVKGGSGTTVTSAALALLLSARHRGGGHVVDLNGDIPAALGISEPLDSSSSEVNSALRLISRPMARDANDTQWLSLATELSSLRGPIVVDVGTLRPGSALLDAATASYLVTRPCYLALRHATTSLGRHDMRIDGCILIDEPGRALTAGDVSSVLHVPVSAKLAVDTNVARAVDAGLLAHRVPKSLDEGLADLVASHTSN